MRGRGTSPTSATFYISRQLSALCCCCRCRIAGELLTCNTTTASTDPEVCKQLRRVHPCFFFSLRQTRDCDKFPHASLASPAALVSALSGCRLVTGARKKEKERQAAAATAAAVDACCCYYRAPRSPLGHPRNKMSPVKRETFENK